MEYANGRLVKVVANSEEQEFALDYLESIHRRRPVLREGVTKDALLAMCRRVAINSQDPYHRFPELEGW